MGNIVNTRNSWCSRMFKEPEGRSSLWIVVGIVDLRRECDPGTINITSVGRRRTNSLHIHSTRCSTRSTVSAQSKTGLSTSTCGCHRKWRRHWSLSCVRHLVAQQSSVREREREWRIVDIFRHKILQLLKLNPQMSDVVVEQRINSFFRRFVRIQGMQMSSIDLSCFFKNSIGHPSTRLWSFGSDAPNPWMHGFASFATSDQWREWSRKWFADTMLCSCSSTTSTSPTGYTSTTNTDASGTNTTCVQSTTDHHRWTHDATSFYSTLFRWERSIALKVSCLCIFVWLDLLDAMTNTKNNHEYVQLINPELF